MCICYSEVMGISFDVLTDVHSSYSSVDGGSGSDGSGCVNAADRSKR